MLPEFIWDPIEGRYRSRGKFYSQADVLRAVDSYLDNLTEGKAETMFNLLRDGKLNIRDLQLIGEREIAKAHLNAAMAARGGRVQMSQADFGRVGGVVGSELVHWRDLMQALADGKPIDGRIRQSLWNYLRAGAATHQRFVDVEMEKRGYTEWRNRLDDKAHHCTSSAGRPSCPGITTKKWRPLAKRVLRGARGCYGACRCWDEYRNPNTRKIKR